MRGPVGRSVYLALFRCTTSAGRPQPIISTAGLSTRPTQGAERGTGTHARGMVGGDQVTSQESFCRAIASTRERQGSGATDRELRVVQRASESLLARRRLGWRCVQSSVRPCECVYRALPHAAVDVAQGGGHHVHTAPPFGRAQSRRLRWLPSAASMITLPVITASIRAACSRNQA